MSTAKIKGDDSIKGRKYELVALSLIEGSIDNNLESFKGYFDISFQGKTIDVKSREFTPNKGWSFTSYKRAKVKPDFYLCFCLHNDEVISIYFFPKQVYGTYLSIFKNDFSPKKFRKRFDKYSYYKVELDKNHKLNSALLKIINNPLPPTKPSKIVCLKCNEQKFITDFYKGTNGVPRGLCKECYKEKEMENNKFRRQYWRDYYKIKKQRKLQRRFHNVSED